MFQLTAIIAFFILGLAFFAIGKDDFGITRIKKDSNDSSSKNEELESKEITFSKKTTPNMEELSNRNSSDLEKVSEISD